MFLYEAILYAKNVLFESFKSDLFAAYNKNGIPVEQNQKVLAAIQLFNNNNLIKNKVKQDLKNPPNIAQALVKTFPNPSDLINYISGVQQGFAEKERQNAEKKQRTYAASTASDDFFIYPCHTFEEAHSAAFSHTGNLERLSNKEIKKKYGVNVPEPATFYKTDKSPSEFLEFMKSAPFFMNPTWCITADKDNWDVYCLTTEKEERPRCYIIISKHYPNVRFCIALGQDGENAVINSDSITMPFFVDELRDPWQIGGAKKIETGKEMIDLAFNKNKVIENIAGDKPMNIVIKFKDIINGYKLFSGRQDLTSWTADLPRLNDAFAMFANCSALTSFSGKLPNIIVSDSMFCRCTNLTSWNVALPNLKQAINMFCDCSALKIFSSDLSNLTIGAYMFNGCSDLTSFSADLPKLTDGEDMFCDCSNLTSFSADLPKLRHAGNIFRGCKLDEASVLHILKSIPDRDDENLWRDGGFRRSDKFNIGKHTNFMNSAEVASLLGTTTPIIPKKYGYKGWIITVEES